MPIALGTSIPKLTEKTPCSVRAYLVDDDKGCLVLH